MTLTPTDLWTIATATLCGIACSVPGCFLVLRRMSMLGDAVSHAVLPGLAVAFMITGARDPIPMLVGAMAAGLVTAGLSAILTRVIRVDEDASLGVVFSTLFAIGVLLVTWVASRVDLDPGCVLYGMIETIALERTELFGGILSVPPATLFLGAIVIINLGVVALFYKELKLVAFDAALATSLGISAVAVHYGLLAMITATTVASFEVVGSILVVTMLVAPGATAQLLTDRLSRMLVLAAGLAATAAVLGYLAALELNTSVAGMISVVAGAQFALAVVASPRHGIVAKLATRLLLGFRIAREDQLADLFREEERPTLDSTLPAARSAAPREGHAGTTILTRLAALSLLRGGLVSRGGSKTGRLMLTPQGRVLATSVVRSHRLWETYLAQNVPLPLDHLHEASHRLEHFISPDLQTRIATELARDADPHGRRIPPPPSSDASRGAAASESTAENRQAGP